MPVNRWKLSILAVLAVACVHAEIIRVPTKRQGAGPLFQIVRDGEWGFMDRTGRTIIAPAFTDERDFFHGLAAVRFPDGKWGYIDQSGKLVIPARFDEVRDFIDDLAPVRIGRKWGYIDTSGRMAIERAFQSAGEFHEGLARIHLWSKVVCTSGTFTSDDAPLWAFHLLEDDKSDLPGCFPQGGRFGYIDKTGKIVIAPQFFIAQDFSEGLAVVRVEETGDSKSGYIDRTGHIVIAPRFNQAYAFSEGLAAVETSGRVVGNQVLDIAWGFIDKSGELVILDKYTMALKFSEGLARVGIKSGESASVGFINHDGKMVIPARFEQAVDFSEGLAMACFDECLYIDPTGSAVLNSFHPAGQFTDGLAVAGFQNSQVYIDKKGRVIAPYSTNK